MLESGLSGSVRGVPSNGHPYRDPGPIPEVSRSIKYSDRPPSFARPISVDDAEALFAHSVIPPSAAS
jgi:hypothetical protein